MVNGMVLGVERMITRAIVLASLAGIASVPARADGLQPGYWKVTSTPQMRGAPAVPQVKMRCLSPEEAADPDKTFTPEHRAENVTCERVEHEMTGTKLTWRLQCTGAMTMNVAGTFTFDSPQHYSAVVATGATINGVSMASRVEIEGERVGECP